MEKELPDMGLVEMQDLESGKQVWVDSASRNLRKEYTDHFEKNRLQNEQSFYRLKADFLSLEICQLNRIIKNSKIVNILNIITHKKDISNMNKNDIKRIA